MVYKIFLCKKFIFFGLLFFMSNLVHAISNEECRLAMCKVTQQVKEASILIRKSSVIIPRINLNQAQMEEGFEYVCQAIKCYDGAIKIISNMEREICKMFEWSNDLHIKSWKVVAEQTKRILIQIKKQWKFYSNSCGSFCRSFWEWILGKNDKHDLGFFALGYQSDRASVQIFY